MAIEIPEEELRYQAVRSSGPGGQHVNKTSTKMELRWNLRESRALSDAQRERALLKLESRLDGDGDLRLTCDETRSQVRNREIVRERLQRLIEEAVRIPRKRKKTKATAGSKRRRLEGKRIRGETKRLRKRPGKDE